MAGALLLGQVAGQVLAGQAVAIDGVAASPAASSSAETPTATHSSVWIWPIYSPGGRPPTVVRPFQPPLRRWDPGHRGIDLVGADEGALDAGAAITPSTGSSPESNFNPESNPSPAVNPGQDAQPSPGQNPRPAPTPIPASASASTSTPAPSQSSPTSPSSPPTQAQTTPAPTPIPTPIHASNAGTVTYAGTLFNRGVVSITHGLLRTTYTPVTPLVHTGDQVASGQVIGLLQPGHCPSRPCLHWGLLVGHGRHVRYYDPSILLGPGRVRLEPVRSR